MEIKLLAVMAMLSAGIYSCSSKAAEDPATPIQEAPKLPVDVTIVAPISLNQTETIAGSVIPNREVEIMSEVNRKVVSINFIDGSQVAKNQLLYKLDDADIRAKIMQLNAELELARINENRFKELLKTESVRQEEYDAAFAKKQILEASADILRADLEKTFVRAPFHGKIGISKVQVGSLVHPGLSLVTLQEQGIVKIQFTVSEKYLPLVKKGNTILFSTELTEARPAKIIATEPGVEKESRNLIVQAIADNSNGKLRPGISARIVFRTEEEHAKNIVLPTQAFIPGSNGYSVFVVKDGLAKLTPVTIGNRTEEQAIVNSGLNAGDTVMVSNILRAMDGTPVQIVSNK